MPANITLPSRLAFLTNRIRFTLTLLDKDAPGNLPAQLLPVTVHQLGADGKPAGILTDGRTDVDGQITFFISDQPPKDISAPQSPLPKIQITVRDVDGDMLGQAISLQPERSKELTAQKISIKRHLDKLAAPMDAWKAATRLSLSTKLEKALVDGKITSLAKLRDTKDIEKTSGLGQAELKELELLRKHARLQLINRDHEINQQLVDAGISDVIDISNLTQSDFIGKLKGKLDEKKAAVMHGMAMKAIAEVNQITLFERVSIANNRTAKSQANATETQVCDCDCQSAVSPLAYLADLLDYTVRHVRLNGTEVTMDKLEALFFQPFASLPADCAASETQVRQLRLCIESLRKKATKDNIDISTIISAHAQRSYPALLAELGVSHIDLRLARSASDKSRQTLADRLGVQVTKLFDFLLFDDKQTEKVLNEVFGLPSTNPSDPTITESALQKAKLSRLHDTWLAAESANMRVRIDPDFMDEAFFAITGTFEEQLLDTRKDELKKLYNDIALAVSSDTAKLTKLMTGSETDAILGMHGLGLGGVADLDELNRQRQERRGYSQKINGAEIPMDFEKLNLHKAELDQLLIVRQLAKEAAATPSDWDEAHHVLSAIEKRKAFVPKWRDEERTKRIVLSPSVFALPGDHLAVLTRLQSKSPIFLRWRLDMDALRDWLTTLEERIAQRNASVASIQAAAEVAEEAHLASLRDSLIEAVFNKQSELDLAGIKNTDSPIEKLEKKRKLITNQLLISAHESACRKTTRTEQAIECLQLLLNGIYSKFFERPGFSLDAPDFEGQWKLLGSYKTWRAVMWVYLYPENLARPSLIKPNRRTAVLGVYDLLVNHWPLLGVDSTIDRPDTEVNWLHWELAQEKAWHLRTSRLFTDSDFMSSAWLHAVWEITLDLRYVSSSLEEESGLGGAMSAAFFESAYYVPLDIGFRLKDEGRPAEALDFLKLGANLLTGRPSKIDSATYLDSLRSSTGPLQRDDYWIESPLPHEAAERIPGGYERRVVLAAIGCYLDLAEAEFARDTAESLARSREAYLAALNLLVSPVLGGPTAPCSALTIDIGDEKIRAIVVRVRDEFLRNSLHDELDRDQIIAADKALEKLIKDHKPSDGIASLRNKLKLEYAKMLPRTIANKSMKSRAADASNIQKKKAKERLGETVVFNRIQIGLGVNSGSLLSGYVRIPAPAFSFCIPSNPVVYLLRLRAESGFFKLTHCMNAAGMKRELQTYSAPTDVTSEVSLELVESTRALSNDFFKPPGLTIYRFKVLIERAKQLVSIAQQVESSYLSFLEKNDAEHYSTIRARQDLGLASATVNLQGLRVDEAFHESELAKQQWDRSDKVTIHYRELIDNGLLQSEQAALDTLRFASLLQTGSIPTSGLQALSAAAQAQSMISSFNSMYASYERRTQDWEFQMALSEIDKTIAETQEKLAEDRKKVTDQERRISQLNHDHASNVVEFLEGKFTNRELYIWMSGIIGDTYRYFLQQASSMAKLAQRQLAFERQAPEQGIILDDYWTYASANSLHGRSDERDRKGMTGSIRLLQDITRLDQHAFFTDRRRITLSKNISLSNHDSLAFMRFRETGILHISTNLDMFDRDFPGDYLRLVKRIRMSVIALIPPQEGIKATLSSTGISRVVRGGDRFVEVSIATQPETVAITSSLSSPGIVDLQQEQADMLLPFEGLGVAGNWVFAMPKAANSFDYDTIADVIFTIEYSAIYSDEFRQQVVQRLNADRAFEGERGFSLRNHFADEWYNLHHPELFDDVSKKLRPELELRRSDYPPNLNNSSLHLLHVTIYFVRKDGVTDEIEVSDLAWKWNDQTGTHIESNAGTLTTRNGMLTTREIPASVWLGKLSNRPPTGSLSFSLGGLVEGKSIDLALREGLIVDILVAVTIRGNLPLWPL